MAVLPSPKFHRYVSVPPLGAVEPALEKVTVSGEYPFVGVADATAVGPLKRMRRICPESKAM